MTKEPITGGCQCGALRFSIESFGRASICHCRMCQKAVGGLYAALVAAHGLKWTRGERSLFTSSNKVKRGFCNQCGTPLTYEYDGGVDVAIAALDNPELAPPSIQINLNDKLSYVDALHKLPKREISHEPDALEFMHGIENYQHPDHDTEEWPGQ